MPDQLVMETEAADANGNLKEASAFNPQKHLMRLRGGQEYLEVKWRLVWFREEHPDWGIETSPVEIDLGQGLAIFSAKVFNAEGKLMATGTKMETRNDFGDYVEKAETGAIGRALAVCGYGTQFAPELEEGDRFVDAPIGPPREELQRGAPGAARGRAASAARVTCSSPGCTTELTRAQVEFSQKQYGQPLCPACQRKQAGRPAVGKPADDQGKNGGGA